MKWQTAGFDAINELGDSHLSLAARERRNVNEAIIRRDLSKKYDLRRPQLRTDGCRESSS